MAKRLVYISIAPPDPQCAVNDGRIFKFMWPYERKRPIAGGILVKLSGNAHSENGRCVLSGYYMNEIVFGLNQGWVETYLGAVDESKVVSSGTYCLARAIAPGRGVRNSQ
jgi:hypothetical protein